LVGRLHVFISGVVTFWILPSGGSRIPRNVISPLKEHFSGLTPLSKETSITPLRQWIILLYPFLWIWGFRKLFQKYRMDPETGKEPELRSCLTGYKFMAIASLY
jgi:hypothetical protein